MLLERINTIAEEMKKNQQYLTDLDKTIGDGDHGDNIVRGFLEIQNQLSTYANLSLSDLCQKIGNIFLTKVGGASGAIYGTGLLAAATSLKEKAEIKEMEMLAVLQDMIAAMQKRGKAVQGDKTLLDTLIPVASFLEAEFSAGKHWEDVRLEVVSIAEKAMKTTEAMEANKGRAAYLGKRSLGCLDPGAVSCYLIIKGLCE